MSLDAKQPICITNATVTTATVDIQTVRIDGKQMTLTMFRQLPEKDIFADTGELIAPAWGWVNYDRRLPSRPFIFTWDGILWRTDVNLEELEWGLYVAEEEDFIRKPFNDECRWIFRREADIDARSYTCYFRFPSKAEAEEWLQTWLKSLMELSTVPQLFIGV